MQEVFDFVCTQRAEPVDWTLSTFIALWGAAHPLDGPAGPRRVLVRGAIRTGFLRTGQKLPARNQCLHPADSFDIQPEVLDEVLDVLDAANVFVGEEAMAGRSPMSDEKSLVLVLPHSGDRQPDLFGEDADGDYRVVGLILDVGVRHRSSPSQAFAYSFHHAPDAGIFGASRRAVEKSTC
jgi:hypothetical protein